MTFRPSLLARRPALALAVIVTTVLGLGVRAVGGGVVAEVGGDALYAVLVYVLVALVAPRARPATLVAVAWSLCAAVELAQLAGLSAAVVAVWEPARWVLGTTFHTLDLVVYAVGACAAGALDVAVGTVVRRRAGALVEASEVSPRNETAGTSSPSGRRDRPPRRDLPSSRS
ncbi:DUF2809 domain-containing protein [Sanguibacter sp. 25GB23B1]|uniref:DUF2809 domain-containing protein n=1 Tax=unclassified Sanguibacter TaxID=2645534 RepID=UPI0032AE9EFE